MTKEKKCLNCGKDLKKEKKPYSNCCNFMCWQVYQIRKKNEINKKPIPVKQLKNKTKKVDSGTERYFIEKGFGENTINVYLGIIKRFKNCDISELIEVLRKTKIRGTQTVVISAMKHFYMMKNMSKEIEVLNNFKKNPNEEKSYTIYHHDKILRLTDFEKETDKEKREWKALFRFLYTSGLRVGELNNIEILTNKTIRIFGKGKKYRVCFYSKKSYDACKNIIGKYTGKTIRLKCKEILGQDYTPHNLRRSYATYLLKNGANPKMVQKTMGHADIKTTYRYFHNTIEELEEEYNKFFKG